MAIFPFSLRSSALIVMVAALLGAVGLAIGHDAFYQSVNRRPVQDTGSLISLPSSLHVSDQQVYVSIGTFMAFVVKSLLGVSASTVFDQFAWTAIQGRTTRIGVIDDLLSALKNGFMVVNFGLWRRYPISMTIAIICWLLPVASMVTPATLSVDSAPFDQLVPRRVPRIEFASTNFANLGSGLTVNTNFTGSSAANDATLFQPVEDQYNLYSGPTPEVQRVVAGATTQGAIAAIEPPSANSSWNLNFHGPAIICETVDQTLAESITQNVEGAINASSTTYGDDDRQYTEATVYGYLSWTPDTNNSVEQSTPFYRPDDNGTYTLRTSSLGPIPDDVINIGDASPSLSSPENPLGDGPPLSLYVATFPHMTDYDGRLDNVYRTARDPTIVRCVLHNATYQTEFRYVNGDQSVQIIDATIHNAMGYLSGVDTAISNSSWLHNRQVMEAFSYQSIMQAFGKLLVGSINEHVQMERITGHDGAMNDTTPTTSNTSAISTTLMETDELQLIQSLLTPKTEDAYMNYWHDKSVTATNHTSRSLPEALEEMFHNVTLSFMSSSLFQPNYTTTSLPNTIITINDHRNIYVYTRSILWTAYGVAIGVTFVSVLAGTWLYFSNHGSYSSKFSTIYRVTQGATVSAELRPDDCRGFDPLPGRLVDARMTPGHDSGCSTGLLPLVGGEGLSGGEKGVDVSVSPSEWEGSQSGESRRLTSRIYNK